VLLLAVDNFENIAPMEEFQVDWVNLAYLGLVDTLALSALPGCRYGTSSSRWTGSISPTWAW
jgi:hypothetical protein